MFHNNLLGNVEIVPVAVFIQNMNQNYFGNLSFVTLICFEIFQDKLTDGPLILQVGSNQKG